MPTYIRVNPPAIDATANSAWSVAFAILSAVLIWVQVTPPSAERQTPPLPATPVEPNAPPYTILFVVPFQPGSSCTLLLPRIVALGLVPLHVAGQPSPPSQMKLNVAPPSVDSKRPKGGLGTGGFVVPPPVTELTPRTPRVDDTKRWFGFVGSITIELIERPRNALPVYVPFVPVPGEKVVIGPTVEDSSVHVFPPSVDL